MTASTLPKASLSKADNVRERELYRYFQPPEPSSSTLSAHEASSPDTTLTALAQLCAHRLHAKRAMISVIDGENQYFIAESTKTLDLANTNRSEVEGDGLWFGCGTVDKSGRLCEKTIEVPPCLGRPPCFTVNDLSSDERFNQLPFVTGPPYFKFYAGTPLTTKKGINIGSLFIIDDNVRETLSLEQEQFLGTMAQTVMKHMEMASEAAERKKVMRLSLGMNAFVEGKSRLISEEVGQDESLVAKNTVSGTEKPSPKKRSDSGTRSIKGSPTKDPVLLARQRRAGSSSSEHGPRKLERLTLLENSRSPSEPDTSQDDSDSSRTAKAFDSGHHGTFARAANILCDSMDLRDSGGVAFFDTTSRFRSSHQDSSERKSQRPAEIISYAPVRTESNEERSSMNGPQNFSPVDESLLFSLLSRYHRGKMWTFDQDGNFSSSEEDATHPHSGEKAPNSSSNRLNRRQVEAVLLQRHFPGVRQIFFSGLWDAGSSRWFAAGLAWTTSSRQILTRETELSYFLAFGNNIMAEVSRLASIAADRQKADFIGSISHEFRSPLHGILASAEFLAETETDAFQSSLVDTISSCGRTLLDTINHILDYSKINAFERNMRNVHKRGSSNRAPINRRLNNKETPPMMNIYATIDVAAITEEVVEGVYAGQIYQDISSDNSKDFSTAGSKKVGKAKEVDVHIDIAHENYVFTTQPGALKRVVMNILGNAMKYTIRGSIMVKLSLDPPDDTAEGALDERMLELKVTDTGKGISREYLRTNLFNPFCQEDPLASGTGLGLSIVRSIVTMLRGTIDIQSEVGKGTEVTVRLPLSRLPGKATPVSTPSSTTTTDSSADESMAILKADHENSIIALLGFSDQGLGPVLKNCIEEWFGFKTATSSTYDLSVSVCIVDERDMARLSQNRPDTVPTVVLCSNASRFHTASRPHMPNTEYVSKPVGPYKLAKALRSCLDRATSRDGLAPVIAFPDEDSPMLSEADTATPGFGMEHLTLEGEPGTKPVEVRTNGVVTAGESENAQMAIDESSATSGDVTVTEDQAFPFPSQDDENDGKKSDQNEVSPDDLKAERASTCGDLTRRDSRRPPLISRMTEPIAKTAFPHSSRILNRYDEGITFPVKPPKECEVAEVDVSHDVGHVTSLPPSKFTTANLAIHNGHIHTDTHQLEEKVGRPPRLLLVDDNKINLRLLEMYMRKRKYEYVSVENGQLAVQAFEAHELGFDIIFMDLSMPCMNGFQASRAIRNIEDARSHNKGRGQGSTPALIIALTGLASSRDQTEAFSSGVDLFMTKPVSFKEVGKLLDNFESNGGIDPPEAGKTPDQQ